MKMNKCLFPMLVICLILAAPGFVCPAEEGQPVVPGAQDKISLDLKNVDIVELLRIISLKTGKTIVPGKEVSGRITIYLNNVAFGDVLDIILLTQGLAAYQKDNVYYVMSAAEYKRLYGRDYLDQRKVETVKLAYAKPSVVFNALGQLKSDMGKIVVDETSGTVILIDIPEKLELFKKTIKEMDQSLDTQVFDLNYAKAADAKTQLSSAITQGTGEVIVDERSGKAIISDLPKKMEKIGMLVRELDEESRQVYVEADIIELTLSDKFQRGIDWSKVYSTGAMDGLTFSGYFPLTLTNYQEISVGTVARDHYKIILDYLDTYGTTNIISQPRIAVLNNEEANIMVGVRDAYVTQTQSQATSTTVTSESIEFVDVGVKLKIVPRIATDGYITMKLKPEVSSVKETITTKLGSRIPIVQTSQSETVVKVKDGMMIMIAGMTKTELKETVLGWPFLSKIPLLGIFFGSREKETKKTEVIIFLTPHIVSGDAGLRGKELENILSNEYLPENLQKKVTRDNAIDKTLDKSETATEEAPAKPAVSVSKDVPTEKVEKPAAKVDKKDAPAAKVEKKDAATKVEKPAQADKTVEDARDYYQRGLRAQAKSDIKEALACFKKATALDNKFSPAYNSMGIIYERQAKFGKAEESYLKAVSSNPHYAPAYSNLALFNESRGDFQQALEYWHKRIFYGDPNDEWTKQAVQRVKELEK